MMFSPLLDAWRDPQMRHAALVHLPIALSLIGLLACLVSASLIGLKGRTLRWVAVSAYALLLLTAIFAVRSGEGAEDELGPLAENVHEIFEEHEHMAEKVWMFALGTGVLLIGAALPRRGIARPAAWLGVLAALATAAWVGSTAHHGGTLVYEWGLGMPKDAARASAALPDGEDERVAFFVNDVRPLLEDSCMGCHNPAKMKRAGGLDQTSIAGLLAGGESGPAVVPGHPDESLLVQAAAWTNEELTMPPDDRGERLTPEEVEILRRWVRDGAVWSE